MSVSDQGVDTNRYFVIPRVLVFLFQEDRVLLIKGNSKKKLWANRFNGIGGHIELGEDPLSAAYRELFEETGISLQKSNLFDEKTSNLWLCGILAVNTGKNPGVFIFIFTGESTVVDPSPSAEGTLHWVKIDEISSLPVVEDLPILINRIVNLKRGETPFFIRSFYDNSKLVVNFISGIEENNQ
jgi:8-oxo-dGTP diphosphatase